MIEIRSANNRGLKEWAVACEALRDGRQTLLIRKGGIREEQGMFRITDKEFFLVPTYDHQKSAQLQTAYIDDLNRTIERRPPSGTLTVDTYASIVNIFTAVDEKKLMEVSSEHIWNLDYIKQRFEFNPYDPLYVLILRTYKLAQPISVPASPDYGGCTSWITLETELSTVGAKHSLSDNEFNTRYEQIRSHLEW